MPLLNVVEYAKHRGTSQPAVSQAIKAGKISRDSNGLLDVDACDAAWPLRPEQIAARETRERAGQSPPQQAHPQRQTAEKLTLALKMEQLSGARLKNQRIRGDLVSRKVAEMLVQTLAQVAKQRVMAVATAAAHQCATAKTAPEVTAILTRALERALADTLGAMPDFVAADGDFAGGE